MVMQMISVQMGGHQDLVIAAPQLPCQLQADCMTLLRRHLSRLEALVGMVGNISIFFAEPLLYGDHLLIGFF